MPAYLAKTDPKFQTADEFFATLSPEEGKAFIRDIITQNEEFFKDIGPQFFDDIFDEAIKNNEEDTLANLRTLAAYHFDSNRKIGVSLKKLEEVAKNSTSISDKMRLNLYRELVSAKIKNVAKVDMTYMKNLEGEINLSDRPYLAPVFLMAAAKRPLLSSIKYLKIADEKMPNMSEDIVAYFPRVLLDVLKTHFKNNSLKLEKRAHHFQKSYDSLTSPWSKKVLKNGFNSMEFNNFRAELKQANIPEITFE